MINRNDTFKCFRMLSPSIGYTECYKYIIGGIGRHKSIFVYKLMYKPLHPSLTTHKIIRI